MRFISLALLLIMLALPSCNGHIQVTNQPTPTSENVLGFSNVLQVYSDGVYSREQVGIAMMIFYELWYENFDDPELKVYNTLSNLAIIWMPQDWRIQDYAYTEGGEKVGGEKGLLVSGLAHEGAVILVSRDDGNLWETSFVHELTHIALHATTGDGDPDHLGDKYPGWTSQHSVLIGLTNSLIQFIYTEGNPDEFELEFVKAIMED